MSKLTTTGLCAALAGAMLLTSCATYTGQTQDPNDPNRTRTGALIGAGIGAVAGLLSGGDAVERLYAEGRAWLDGSARPGNPI